MLVELVTLVTFFFLLFYYLVLIYFPASCIKFDARKTYPWDGVFGWIGFQAGRKYRKFEFKYGTDVDIDDCGMLSIMYCLATQE